jgi:5-methyltetrahydropteroyltriglutamate--homocysteine methyltransferase
MALPTEPIGSIPRPRELIDAVSSGADSTAELYDRALRDTIEQFEATGSPVITDGEQTKPSFATYPLAGLDNLTPGGAVIPFEDGHTRQLPLLAAGPFRYAAFADQYLAQAKAIATVPVKQAVIAASALSLIYPPDAIAGYSQQEFLADLVDEAEADIRRCLEGGAHNVQVDFTEGRLSLKLDPSKGVLHQFIALNNSVLERFTEAERLKIGVHTCPGGDHNSTHSADIPYEGLLPSLFELKAGSFYIQLASEQDPAAVLELIREHSKPDQRIFVGVIDPISENLETPEQVRDRILLASEYIPLERLGSTDDCGFSPFGDDTATPRELAFAKIRARVEGTALASEQLGV